MSQMEREWQDASRSNKKRRGGHEHTMSSRCSKKPEKDISKCETQKKMKLTESLRRWVKGRKGSEERKCPIIHCFHADSACQRPDYLMMQPWRHDGKSLHPRGQRVTENTPNDAFSWLIVNLTSCHLRKGEAHSHTHQSKTSGNKVDPSRLPSMHYDGNSTKHPNRPVWAPCRLNVEWCNEGQVVNNVSCSGRTCSRGHQDAITCFLQVIGRSDGRGAAHVHPEASSSLSGDPDLTCEWVMACKHTRGTRRAPHVSKSLTESSLQPCWHLVVQSGTTVELMHQFIHVCL